MNYKGGNKIWEQADEIADMNFENKGATTDFFLEIFLCFRKKHYLCIRFQGRTFREPTRSDL